MNANEPHNETSQVGGDASHKIANQTSAKSNDGVGDEFIKKREPPAQATELDFPICRPSGLPRNQLGSNHDLVKAFRTIVREGPSRKHLEALNISLKDNTPLEQLLPNGYIPPLSWAHSPNTAESYHILALTSDLSPVLSNNATIPTRKIFYDTVKELMYDYEDAFRAVRREKPLPDHPPVRIAYFRKFWDGLITMASFWDTSKDHYSSEKPESPVNNSEGGEKSALDIDELQPEVERADRDENIVNLAEDSRSSELLYTGRRVGTGSEMPEGFRNDTVFAFVETIAWAFRCKLDVAQFQHQKLHMQGMTIGLPMAASVYRIPKDQQRARKGIKDGPMFGVFPRGHITFRGPQDEIGEGKAEIYDLLWEVALMMMLAQKRGREGKVEEVPGAGKWWANAPRWGGKTGGEVGSSEDETLENPSSSDDQLPGYFSRDKKVEVKGSGGKRKPEEPTKDDAVEDPVSNDDQQPENSTQIEAIAASPIDRSQPRKYRRKAGSWPDVQPPGGGNWEKNIDFHRVGKSMESDYDDASHHLQCLQGSCSDMFIDISHLID